MKQKGWIKLHRSILENPLASKPLWAWLWVVLLLKANHETRKVIWNGKSLEIKAGQLITGRHELSKACGLKPTSVERALKYLENEHQIGQQKTTKYRIITILKWELFQEMDNKVDNRRTTKGQQTDTNKNDKNVKNNILQEDKPPAEEKVFVFEDELTRLRDGTRKDYKIIALYWKKKGWEFENREQFNAALRRELRPAKALMGYTGHQIAEAIGYCMKEYPELWTLETIHKRITDIINKK